LEARPTGRDGGNNATEAGADDGDANFSVHVPGSCEPAAGGAACSGARRRLHDNYALTHTVFKRRFCVNIVCSAVKNETRPRLSTHDSYVLLQLEGSSQAG